MPLSHIAAPGCLGRRGTGGSTRSSGFRSGWYEDEVEPTAVAFADSWDLRRLRPHPFPRGAGVVFGNKAATHSPRGLPSVTERWTGRLSADARRWKQAAPSIHRERVPLGQSFLADSPYKPHVRNGATIFPKVLFFVETDSGGRLGLGAGRHAVRSARTNLEKAPWKDLPALEGVVESEFIRPVLLGECLLPYRILPAKKAVLPLDCSTLMTGPGARLDYYFGLAEWWRKAETTWDAHRSSTRLTLAERLDFHRGLTAQFPAPPLRLVYSASGMHVAAAIVDDPTAVIEHKLYWAPIATREEGIFLSAILNSSALTELVRPMMSYGKDERDIDKHVWKLPIPQFDDANAMHQRLADLGWQQSETVAGLHLAEGANFVTMRRRIRAELTNHPATSEIEVIVAEMLD